MAEEVIAPSPGDVALPVFRHLLSLYPAVLQSFYQDKVKGSEQKRLEALEDDTWRYVEFPHQLRQRQSGKGLTKSELERLVKWKITHQTNRPFLLPQIRKNDPKTVEKCTSEARDLLLGTKHSKSIEQSSPSRESVRKALDKVCELNGVGPATGTLVLSLYDTAHVPFFEDELYAWLFPGSDTKLKYNTKEYFQMLDKILEFQKSGGKPENSHLKPANAYEKAAFVCQHWNLVDAEGKLSLKSLPHEEAETQHHQEKANAQGSRASPDQKQQAHSEHANDGPSPQSHRKRKAPSNEESVDVKRRSTRIKK